MASWNDIQAHLRATYRLQTDEPTSMAMTWAYEDGRSQKIVVRKFENGGVDMVEFKSPFAKLGGPDPIELLRENSRIPIGAVALSSDFYLIVHNVEIAPLTLDAFDGLMARVAGLADKLETKHAALQDAF